jgi:bud site selection protein 20
LDIKKNVDELLNQEVDLEKPGFAQHYCVHCAKYFINDQAMKDHFKTKVHKKQMKKLINDPYTHEEAELAAGRGSFTKLPQKRKIEQQPTREEYDEGKRMKMDYFTQEELNEMKNKKKKRRSTLNASNVENDQSMQE